MVPQERLNFNSNWAIFTGLAACTAASAFWTGSADMESRPLLCRSFTFNLHQSNCQTPRTTYAHVVQSSHYHHTLSLAHDKFQKVEILCPLKRMTERISPFVPFSSTVAILKLLLSFHVIWGADSYWYLVPNACTNWALACQLNEENLTTWM